MAKIARQAVPIITFLLILWIGHAAIVDHVTVVLAVLILIAAGAIATLTARI